MSILRNIFRYKIVLGQEKEKQEEEFKEVEYEKKDEVEKVKGILEAKYKFLLEPGAEKREADIEEALFNSFGPEEYSTESYTYDIQKDPASGRYYLIVEITVSAKEVVKRIYRWTDVLSIEKILSDWPKWKREELEFYLQDKKLIPKSEKGIRLSNKVNAQWGGKRIVFSKEVPLLVVVDEGDITVRDEYRDIISDKSLNDEQKIEKLEELAVDIANEYCSEIEDRVKVFGNIRCEYISIDDVDEDTIDWVSLLENNFIKEKSKKV